MKSLLNLLTSHPYTVLVLCGLLERVGFPLLLSPILVGAGALAASGGLRFDVAWWIVLLACVAGGTFWYELGRKKGRSGFFSACRISPETQSAVRRPKTF